MLFPLIIVTVLAMLYVFSTSLPSLNAVKIYCQFGWNLSKYMVKRCIRTLKNRITEHFSSNVTTMTNGNIIVSYIRKGREHKICLEDDKGSIRSPSNVMIIYDDEQNDVTDEISAFMGPKNNFHHQRYTPRILGHTTLAFELVSGRTLTFSRDEVIDLNMFIS